MRIAAFHAFTRLATRAALRKQGKSRSEIADIIDYATDDVIDAVASEGKVGAFGDGVVIKNILDWLGSPEGQAFIKMLIEIIMTLIAAA